MKVWTSNKQDLSHLFSMAVIYKVSLHLDVIILVCISIISKKSKINDILSEFYL